MNRHPKVVHLNQPGDSGNGTIPVHLPLPLIKLRDEMTDRLRQRLRSMLDQVDDALFQRADRAGSNAEQEVYFSAMREFRLKRKGLELAFGQAMMNAFQDLGRQVAEPKPTVAEVDPETLSLVQNDELEEQVAVDGMVNKAQSRFAQALQQLSIRIDSLLPYIRVLDEQNPLAPRRLCEAFLQACSDIEVDIRVKLVVLKLFDKMVLESIGELYDQANQLLADLGVLPGLQVPRAGARPVVGGSRAGTPGVAKGGEAAEGEQDTFGVLQALISSRRGQEGAMPGLVLADPVRSGVNIPALSQSELLSLLSSAQVQLSQAEGSLPGQTANGLLDVEQLLGGLLRQNGRSGRIHQVDGDVVNLVSMLFEFILNDRQLPATMKALLARLQIPVLKVALLDKSFFGKASHPARQLLNELAWAGMGWNEKGPGEPDPLLDKIEDIVQRLVADFSQDLSLFEELLAEFQQFMLQERRRGQLVEQRTRDAEMGRAKAELARREVMRALDELLAGRNLPDTVLKLVREGWCNVMVLIHLKQGRESAEWEQALNLARDLIWSLNPAPEPGARSRLLHMIPKLLKGLREGLGTTSFSPFEMDRLLKELERLHLRALRRLSIQPGAVPAVEKRSVPQSPADRTAEVPAGETPVEADAGLAGEPVSKPVLDAAPAPVMEPAGVEVDVVEVDVARKADEPATAQPVPEAAELSGEPVEIAAVSGEIRDSGPAEPDRAAIDPAGIPAEALQRVDTLGVGCWMEFREDDGKKFRAKLAAVITAVDKYVFVNRSGVKVAERTRLELASELHRGLATVLDDGLLFDRALAAVIGNLRGARQA